MLCKFVVVEVKFYLAWKRSWKRRINMYNFMLKLQAVSQKLAKNIRGLLFDSPWGVTLSIFANLGLDIGHDMQLEPLIKCSWVTDNFFMYTVSGKKYR